MHLDIVPTVHLQGLNFLVSLFKPVVQCNKMADKLENLWWQNILFLFYFLSLCNNLKHVKHYNSKEIYKII